MEEGDLEEGIILQCRKCIEELPEGMSPREFAKIEVAVNREGKVLVSCVRHDTPVVGFDADPEFAAFLFNTGCQNPGCTHGHGETKH
jgi:hypothetical protein